MFARAPTPNERVQARRLWEQVADPSDNETSAKRANDPRVWKELIHALYNLKEFTYLL